MMGPSTSRKLLFITWDGPDLTYLQSLFLPIFTGLQKHGVHTDVLQFRWGDPALTRAVAERCRAAGCGYRAVRIIRAGGGIGALASALWGARAVRAAVRDFGSDLLMPRAIMPAIATLAAGGPDLRPIILDADGLSADERVDFAGQSPFGATYRMLRDAEAQAVRRSKVVITRSDAASRILHARAGPSVDLNRFHTVTNGRDDRVFTPGEAAARAATRDRLGLGAEAPVIVYAGSIGPQYRFDRLARFMEALVAIRPDARLLVLSRDVDTARRALDHHGPDVARAALIRSAEPDDVPALLACGDLGVAFRAASFSTVAVAPIKLSEYLLCGLPILGTRGIGDTAAAIEAGVLLDPGDDSAAAARWFTETVLRRRQDMRDEARAIGLRHFSLARSVDDYRKALDDV